jgi:hypothetical protein
MEARRLISSVVEYLKEQHRCHKLLLYGSYARGDHTSEIDLDVFVHPTSDAETLDDGGLLKIKDAVIVCDPRGLGALLEAKAKALPATPPKPQQPWELLQSVAWCRRMLRRASKCNLKGVFELASNP